MARRHRPDFAGVVMHAPAQCHDPDQWEYPQPFDRGAHSAAAAMAQQGVQGTGHGQHHVHLLVHL